jgi:hypothetical protein
MSSTGNIPPAPPMDNNNVPSAPPMDSGVPMGDDVPVAPPVDGIPAAPDMDEGIPMAPDMDGGVPVPPPMDGFPSASSKSAPVVAKPLTAAQLETEKRKQRIQQLEEELKELIKNKSEAEAKKALEAHQRQSADFDSVLTTKIDNLTNKNTETSREMERAEADIKEKQDTIAKDSNRIAKWGKNTDNDKKVKRVSELRDKVAQLKKDIDELREALPVLKKRYNETQQQIEESKKELEGRRYRKPIYMKAIGAFIRPAPQKKEQADAPPKAAKLKGDEKAAAEYSQLENYMYDKNGVPDDFALEILREKYYDKKKNESKAKEISTYELKAFIKSDLEFGRITPKEIQEMVGFDVVAARELRAKEAKGNRKQSDKLGMLKNFKHDKDGNESNEPLNKLRKFFSEELFLKPEKFETNPALEKTLKEGILDGRFNAALITEIVGLDIVASIENKEKLDAEKAKAVAELQAKLKAEADAKAAIEAESKAKNDAEIKLTAEKTPKLAAEAVVISNNPISHNAPVSSEVAELRATIEEFTKTNAALREALARAEATTQKISTEPSANPMPQTAAVLTTPKIPGINTPTSETNQPKQPDARAHKSTNPPLSSQLAQLEDYTSKLKARGPYSGLQFWKSNQKMKLEAALTLVEHLTKLNNEGGVKLETLTKIANEVEVAIQKNRKADRYGYHPHGKLETILNDIKKEIENLKNPSPHKIVKPGGKG